MSMEIDMLEKKAIVILRSFSFLHSKEECVWRYLGGSLSWSIVSYAKRLQDRFQVRAHTQ